MKITARIEFPKKITAKFKELKMPLSGGYEQGFEDGKEAGYVDGVKDGEVIGYEKGHSEGYEDGYSTGKPEGEAIGYEKGHSDGYSEGYSEGSAYYDQFWDVYQQNGERTNYEYAFAGNGWTNDTFKPKHKKIKVGVGSNMFAYSEITGDLRDYVDIEWVSGSKTYMFQNSKFEKIGVFSTVSSNATQIFYNASNLVFVELFKFHNESVSFSNTFKGCKKLEEIRFDDTIANSIDFKDCPLSVESMKDIIAHLQNFNGTGKENTKKVSFSDACWSALEADSTAPNGGTWKEYVQFTLCWNV